MDVCVLKQYSYLVQFLQHALIPRCYAINTLMYKQGWSEYECKESEIGHIN